jgi:polyisoprenoid-binding protein YceI
MSLTDVVLSATGLPTGTWRLDPTHSSAGFVVKDENLQAHLGSPEFFDIERHPEITFQSTAIRRAAVRSSSGRTPCGCPAVASRSPTTSS